MVEQHDEPDDGDEPEAVQAESRPIVRDAKTGRWLPGTSSPHPAGCPRGARRPRLSDVARDLVGRQGVTLDDALAAVLAAVMRKAGAGDMTAAKILLDRLAVDEIGPEPGVGVVTGPQLPTGRALAAYMHDFANAERSKTGGGVDRDAVEAGAEELDRIGTAVELDEQRRELDARETKLREAEARLDDRARAELDRLLDG